MFLFVIVVIMIMISDRIGIHRMISCICDCLSLHTIEGKWLELLNSKVIRRILHFRPSAWRWKGQSLKSVIRYTLSIDLQVDITSHDSSCYCSYLMLVMAFGMVVGLSVCL